MSAKRRGTITTITAASTPSTTAAEKRKRARDHKTLMQMLSALKVCSSAEIFVQQNKHTIETVWSAKRAYGVRIPLEWRYFFVRSLRDVVWDLGANSHIDAVRLIVRQRLPPHIICILDTPRYSAAEAKMVNARKPPVTSEDLRKLLKILELDKKSRT